MWGAFARQLFAYVLTRRGKKVLAFVGAMLLCFLTALLVDLHLYLTAGFTGVLAVVALFTWLVQHVKHKRAERARLRHEVDETLRRAAAAAARSETMEKARSSVADAARNMTSGVYGAAKWGVTGTWDIVTLRRWRSGSAVAPQPAQPGDVLRIPRIAHSGMTHLDQAVGATIDHRASRIAR
jgi:hypothetical protein